MKLLLVVFAAMAVMVYAEKARYDNYKVYKVTPTTLEQLDALRYLEEHSDSYSFWKQSRGVGHDADIMVAPHKFSDFQDMIKLSGMNHSVMIDDVQKNFDAENEANSKRAGFGWTAYNNIDDIYAWLTQLAVDHKEVELIKGGSTYEKRDILGVKISFRAGNQGVFLEAGIHAREWIGPATATWVINELLTSSDPAVRKVAESWDWYVFPSTNPDGYVYTWKSDRNWRKTRSPQGLFSHGVDANRNWGFHWMEVYDIFNDSVFASLQPPVPLLVEGGASSLPSSETYAGPSAFSEIETKSLSDYYLSIQNKITVYLSLHSYSQLLMIPYGYTLKHLDQHEKLMDISRKAKTAFAKRFGTSVTIGAIYETIYQASGSSLDWAAGVTNTPFPFVYELRDTGKYGFALPADQIIPSGQELLDSFVAILDESTVRDYRWN